jgi:hypothetical protein
LPKAKPVVLPSFNWDKQGEALAAFQAILARSGYGINDRITDPTHELMLNEVLDRHPDAVEKIGVGVEYFFVGKTSGGDKFNVGKNARGIWIHRTDGSDVDFSYETAIKLPSDRANAHDALKLAVDGRRMEYRASRFASGSPVTSDLTGAPISSRDEAVVYYENPSWAQLAYRFAEIEGGWSAVLVHSGHGGVKIGGGFEDKAMESRWLKFFDMYANPRLAASMSESASRPRSDETAWTP